MDIQRPSSGRRRWLRRLPVLILAVVVLVLTIAAFAMLDRPPAVESERLWFGTAERGEMLREVAASGQLVAPHIRAVTNRNAGVVEEVHVLPGDEVSADSVLVTMSSPQLEEDLAQARWDLAATEAEEAVARIEAENRHFDIIAQLASAEAEYTAALMELQAQEELSEAQVYSALELERQRLQVQQLKRRLEAEEARLERSPEHRAAKESATQARIARQRDKVAHLESLVAQLEVRAGSSGVIQEVNITEGEQLTAGELVARIVDPSHLIARLHVPEREAADIVPGFPVTLELGRTEIAGEVIRIDPVATDRTILVDVELVSGNLPTLRPDQTISGRIELERIEDVVHFPRPSGVREENRTVGLFVVTRDGSRARRVNVELGRLSTTRAEVRNGLEPGDRVILAEMEDFAENEVVRIR